MPRLKKLVPVHSKWAAKNQWSVSLPPHVSTTGKRQRFFFKTRVAAEEFCSMTQQRIEDFGFKGSENLPPMLQGQAVEAFELLAPFRVSLKEVVTDWISRRRAAEASIPFEDAMEGYAEWGRRSTTYERSIRQIRNRLATLHGKKLNTVTPEDLTIAMDSMTGSVRNFTIRILRGLFNWGIKRGHCADNPCKRLDLAQRESVEIEIYTPAEVSAILSAAENHSPELVPFLAVSFFCGIRRSEALRLDWSAIDLHERFIKLPAAITKTRQGRHIEISESCSAWLSLHLTVEGRVTPCTPDVLRKRLEALKSVHKVRTIKHGARHCFASYWLAKHGDIDTLCRSLGHDDPKTTFKHYAKVATKRDAEKFWSINPRGSQVKNVVNFQNTQRHEH